MTAPKEEITLTAAEAAALRQGFTYCPRCRAEMVDREAYDRIRRVCPECHFVQFIDPKVSAAVLALTEDDRALLVKRAVEPAQGSWCLPGGFIEIGETPQQAASRECQEESGFEVEIDRLIDVCYYEDYRGSGILVLYRGTITNGRAQPGDDVQEVGLFGAEDLPDDIAFDSNIETLALWRAGKI